jgi:transposase-like protein
MDQNCLRESMPSPMIFSDENEAVAYFTAIRWRHGPQCPYCNASRIYHFSDGRTHRCGECRRKFTIRAGTIFEDSKVGLSQWLYAVRFVIDGEGHPSSSKLARQIGVTQKTAWLMLQRIRYAASTNSFNGRPPQKLIVEG